MPPRRHASVWPIGACQNREPAMGGRIRGAHPGLDPEARPRSHDPAIVS
jgi:hypothetical protein